MPARSKLFLHGALAAALYTLTALVYLRPIAQVYADHIAPDPGDPIFTLYVLKWVLHQAHLGFPDLWNPNIFFPAKGALAFSDPFLGPALEIYFFKNAIIGYNFLFFTSFVLTGLGVWWMLRRNGASAVAALLAGAMYAFTPFRFSHLNHMSMLLGQWIPFALWSFDRLLAEPRPRRAALFLLFYGLNLTSGCYFAYMIHFPLLALLVSRGLADRRALLRPAALKVLLLVVVLAGAAAFAQFLPFLQLSKRLNMKRDEREVVKNAATLASYASPSSENRYSLYSSRGLWGRASLPDWQQPFVRTENALFPGFLATLAGGLGFALFWRRYRIRGSRPVASFWRRLVLWGLPVVALAALVLGDIYTLHLNLDTFLTPWLPEVSRTLWIGLGAVFAGSLALWVFLRRRFSGSGVLAWRAMEPWERGLVLSGIACFLLSLPLVYVPLMGIIPGMNGMRVPARFDAFLGITIVFFAARGLDGFFVWFRRPAARVAAVALLSVALFVELQPRPVHWIAILPETEFPEVYQWIAGRSDVRALLEIPMRAYWHETPYMYYSTLHWKPIANGYSSFIPPSYDRLSNQVLRFLPDAAAVDLMAEMGISHMIVHSDDLGGSWRRSRDPVALLHRWEERLEGRVELVHDSDPDRVYRIVRIVPHGH